MASQFDLIRLLRAFGILRNSPDDGQLLPAPQVPVAKTANYTISPADKCGTLFTNRGAAGPVTFTLLPLTAVPAGTWYEFLGVEPQLFIVAAPIPGTLLTRNDAAANSVTIQNAGQIIGSLLKVKHDGTQWIAIGETVGVTYAIGT